MTAKDRQTLLVNLEIMVAQQKEEYDPKRAEIIQMIRNKLSGADRYYGRV